ncbi:MAG: DUF4399 domain-containing protein [Oligoflexales bacterium]|nr:DUF4399 domain-containing protein [Oligoflexales bacterium]
MKFFLGILLLLSMGSAFGKAEVYFIKPKNGEKFKSGDVEVVFGLKGMGIAPAGINAEKTGHHHLLINYKGLPDMTKPLPAGENLLHFGGGQTQTTIKLKKGTHKLRLILGDYLHTPHKPLVMSEEITIYVES